MEYFTCEQCGTSTPTTWSKCSGCGKLRSNVAEPPQHTEQSQPEITHLDAPGDEAKCFDSTKVRDESGAEPALDTRPSAKDQEVYDAIVLEDPLGGSLAQDQTPQSTAATNAQADTDQAEANTAVPCEQSGHRFVEELSRKIEPVRIPWTYRIGILLVCIAMILLPLLYVSLIVLVGWCVCYHMVHHVGMLGYGTGRGKLMVFLAYLAPVVAGSSMVLFMVKPLFARATSAGRGRPITREREPILLAFVDRLCDVVSAPRPRRVDVDCEVNASASFRRGLWSVMGGHDLVLTIGLPLVAGMTMRQFAGVLAHEFGHFSQGAGMRLTYLVRTISYWFTRVVYDRDTWDEWLAKAAQGIDIRIGWVFFLAQGCVWLTRRILWCLMMVGHLVSGFLLRQMEFDADRYQIKLVGSDGFESTFRRLREVSVTYEAAVSSLRQYYQENKLGDNLPRLIQFKLDDLPEETQKQLAENIDESKTGWLDTHPSDKDRIANAYRAEAEAVFAVERPASELFSNYESLCQDVTEDFYRFHLALPLVRLRMTPIGHLIARQKKEKEDSKSLDRFFLGVFNLRVPRLPTTHLEAPTEPKSAFERMHSARNQMASLRDAYQDSIAKYDDARKECSIAAAAVAVYRANIIVPAEMFKVTSQDEAWSAFHESEAILERTADSLVEFEAAAGERLIAALELLFLPHVAAEIPDAQAQIQDAQRLLPLIQRFGLKLPVLKVIRNQFACLSTLCSGLSRNPSNEHLTNSVLHHSGELISALTEFRESFLHDKYPFDHNNTNPLGEGASASDLRIGMTLGCFLVPGTPPANQIVEVQQVANEFLERSSILYGRMLSQLAGIAERAEEATGQAFAR